MIPRNADEDEGYGDQGHEEQDDADHIDAPRPPSIRTWVMRSDLRHRYLALSAVPQPRTSQCWFDRS